MKEQLMKQAMKMKMEDLENLIQFCISEKLHELVKIYVHAYRLKIEKDF